MSLSDCPKCWMTPCECGYDYQNMPDERLVAIHRAVSGAMAEKRAKQQAGYSIPQPILSFLLEVQQVIIQFLHDNGRVLNGHGTYVEGAVFADQNGNLTWTVPQRTLTDDQIRFEGEDLYNKIKAMLIERNVPQLTIQKVEVEHGTFRMRMTVPLIVEFGM